MTALKKCQFRKTQWRFPKVSGLENYICFFENTVGHKPRNNFFSPPKVQMIQPQNTAYQISLWRRASETNKSVWKSVGVDPLNCHDTNHWKVEKNMPPEISRSAGKNFSGPCRFEWESQKRSPSILGLFFWTTDEIWSIQGSSIYAYRCWAQVQCNWLTYVRYMYLEPNWPLFLRVNLPKQGPNSNQNNGHWGSRYTIPASSRRDLLIAQMEVRFSRPEVVSSGSKRGHDLKNMVSGSPLATTFLFVGCHHPKGNTVSFVGAFSGNNFL